MIELLSLIISSGCTLYVTLKISKQNNQFNKTLQKIKFQNSNNQLKAVKHIEIITTSRIDWIQNLKENTAILLSNLRYFIILMRLENRKSIHGYNNDLVKIWIHSSEEYKLLYNINKILLQLNYNDKNEDYILINNLEILKTILINDIFNMLSMSLNEGYRYYTELLERTDRIEIEIKNSSQKILKKEWERVKNEIPDKINF